MPMNTPVILNSSAAAANGRKPANQAGEGAPDVPFNQVLSREIGSRRESSRAASQADRQPAASEQDCARAGRGAVPPARETSAVQAPAEGREARELRDAGRSQAADDAAGLQAAVPDPGTDLLAMMGGAMQQALSGTTTGDAVAVPAVEGVDDNEASRDTAPGAAADMLALMASLAQAGSPCQSVAVTTPAEPAGSAASDAAATVTAATAAAAASATLVAAGDDGARAFDSAAAQAGAAAGEATSGIGPGQVALRATDGAGSSHEQNAVDFAAALARGMGMRRDAAGGAAASGAVPATPAVPPTDAAPVSPAAPAIPHTSAFPVSPAEPDAPDAAGMVATPADAGQRQPARAAGTAPVESDVRQVRVTDTERQPAAVAAVPATPAVPRDPTAERHADVGARSAQPATPATPVATVEAATAAQQAQSAGAVQQGAHVAHAHGNGARNGEHIAPRVGTPAWDNAIGQKIVWMVGGGEQSATLTLNPPDLGPLQVVLNVSNTTATAAFTAAQPEVRQALENAMPKLRDMLGDAGIQLGQATVDSGARDPNNARPDGGQRTGWRSDEGIAIDTPVQAPQRAVAAGNGLVDTFV